MSCPAIFICYSRQDLDYKNALYAHLSILKRRNLARIWSDEDIPPGDDWKSNILRAIETTDIAILLLSSNFLSSDFIMDEEVPRLLERSQSGLTIFPILASPCLWDADEALEKLQIMPRDGQAVFERPETKLVLWELAKEIAELVGKKSDIQARGALSPAATIGLYPGKEKRSWLTPFWTSATLQLKLAMLAVVTLVLWMVTVGFTARKHIGPLPFHPFNVTVLSPRFLSPNEVEELDFNIMNEGDQKLPAKFLLTNVGSGSVPTIVGVNKDSVVFKGEVASHEVVRGNTTVLCLWEMGEGTNYLGGLASLSLARETEGGLQRQDLPVRVAPIPWIRKLQSGSGLLLVVFWAFFFVAWSLKVFASEKRPA